MKRMDRIHMKYPFKGSRRLAYALRHMEGLKVGCKQVQKLMRVEILFVSCYTAYS